jgi:molybdopterin converting factor small subunit
MQPTLCKGNRTGGGAFTMSKTLWLSANLSRLAKGTEGFEVDGETVGNCIDEVISLVPSMRNAIFYQSRLNRNVQVQVNRESIEGAELLARNVKDGDEIRIMLKGH